MVNSCPKPHESSSMQLQSSGDVNAPQAITQAATPSQSTKHQCHAQADRWDLNRVLQSPASCHQQAPGSELVLQRCASTRMPTGHPPDLLAAAAGPSWGAAGASDSHLGSEEGSTPSSWQSCLPPSCIGCTSGGQSAVTHTLTSPSHQQSDHLCRWPCPPLFCSARCWHMQHLEHSRYVNLLRFSRQQ